MIDVGQRVTITAGGQAGRIGTINGEPFQTGARGELVVYVKLDGPEPPMMFPVIYLEFIPFSPSK